MVVLVVWVVLEIHPGDHWSMAGLTLFLDDPTAGQPWRGSLKLDVSALFRSPSVSHIPN